MLAVSRLYSFLDHTNGVNLHFMEGQKLIHDLVLLHPMTPSGFSYFRDTFLGLMPVIFFLKPGESLGIYIDSEEPYFRLKIETNSAGHTRSLLLPENFDEFPKTITGKIRITKIFNNGKTPYTSMLELKDTPTKDVVNRIFSESYQTNSEVIVSDKSDQSILVTKLPALNTNIIVDESISRKAYIQKNQEFINSVFNEASNDIEQIVKKFEDNGLAYLGSRQVNFFCPCSLERMVMNLKGLYSNDVDELFDEKGVVDITCDYCRKQYHISKADVIGS